MIHHYILHINEWGPSTYGPFTSYAEAKAAASQEITAEPEDDILSIIVNGDTGEIEISSEEIGEFMEEK